MLVSLISMYRGCRHVAQSSKIHADFGFSNMALKFRKTKFHSPCMVLRRQRKLTMHGRHRRQLSFSKRRHVQQPGRRFPAWISSFSCSSGFFVAKCKRLRRLEPVVHTNDYWSLWVVVRLS